MAGLGDKVKEGRERSRCRERVFHPFSEWFNIKEWSGILDWIGLKSCFLPVLVMEMFVSLVELLVKLGSFGRGLSHA